MRGPIGRWACDDVILLRDLDIVSRTPLGECARSRCGTLVTQGGKAIKFLFLGDESSAKSEYDQMCEQQRSGVADRARADHGKKVEAFESGNKRGLKPRLREKIDITGLADAPIIGGTSRRWPLPVTIQRRKLSSLHPFRCAFWWSRWMG